MLERESKSDLSDHDQSLSSATKPSESGEPGPKSIYPFAQQTSPAEAKSSEALRIVHQTRPVISQLTERKRAASSSNSIFKALANPVEAKEATPSTPFLDASPTLMQWSHRISASEQDFFTSDHPPRDHHELKRYKQNISSAKSTFRDRVAFAQLHPLVATLLQREGDNPFFTKDFKKQSENFITHELFLLLTFFKIKNFRDNSKCKNFYQVSLDQSKIGTIIESLKLNEQDDAIILIIDEKRPWFGVIYLRQVKEVTHCFKIALYWDANFSSYIDEQLRKKFERNKITHETCFRINRVDHDLPVEIDYLEQLNIFHRSEETQLDELQKLEEWLSSVLTDEEQSMLSPFGFDQLPKKLQEMIDSISTKPEKEVAPGKKLDPIDERNRKVENEFKERNLEYYNALQYGCSVDEDTHNTEETEYEVNYGLSSVFPNNPDAQKLFLFIESSDKWDDVETEKIEICQKLLLLFQTYEKCILYFRMCADYQYWQLSDDYGYTVLNIDHACRLKMPESDQDWHPVEWGKLIFKFKHRVLPFIEHAVKIESAMKEAGRTFENVTWPELESYCSADLSHIVALGKLCEASKIFISDKELPEILPIINKITAKERWDALPDLAISHPEHKGYTLQKMAAGDVRRLLLTDHRDRFDYVNDIDSPYVSIYFITDKNGCLLAYIPCWMGKNGALVIQSIQRNLHLLRNYESRNDDVMKIIWSFIRPFVKELHQSGFTNIQTKEHLLEKMLFTATDEVQPIDKDCKHYSDSWSKPKIISKLQPKLFHQALRQTLEIVTQVKQDYKGEGFDAACRDTLKQLTPEQFNAVFLQMYRSGFHLLQKLLLLKEYELSLHFGVRMQPYTSRFNQLKIPEEAPAITAPKKLDEELAPTGPMLRDFDTMRWLLKSDIWNQKNGKFLQSRLSKFVEQNFKHPDVVSGRVQKCEY
ncbi:MAG: hypothetical protein ACYCQI_16815 [Gammaproteobacteria bacterium]